MNENRMKPAEAAEFLGISEGTLNNMRNKGNGPDYYKLGGIFYKQCDLDAFVESKKVAGSGKTE